MTKDELIKRLQDREGKPLNDNEPANESPNKRGNETDVTVNVVENVVDHITVNVVDENLQNNTGNQSDIYDDVVENVVDENLQNNTGNQSDIHENVVDNVFVKVTKRMLQIIELMKYNDKITISHLAKILKVNTRTVDRDMIILKDHKIIDRIGHNNGRWIILNPKED